VAERKFGNRGRAFNNGPRIFKRLGSGSQRSSPSMHNWYWLVDGLKAAGYTVKLVNPSAMQYQGLKYSDDRSDARWLAEMLRLGILPSGTFTRKRNDRYGTCCASGAFWSDRAPVNGCTPS
jgi:hypothetical protein